jgi:hypothetical protein
MRSALLKSALLAGMLIFWVGAKSQPYLEASNNPGLSGHISRSDVVEYATGNALLDSQLRTEMTYQKLSKQLDDVGREKLFTAQQAWTTYSRANCDFTSHYSPADPLHPTTYNDCLVVMNTERFADLQYQLQWFILLDPSLSIVP